MGKLDSHLSTVSGYLGQGGEDRFPWKATQGIWYLLLVVEDGKICRYGFTSASVQKYHLSNALKALKEEEALLLGVWTDNYSLCALDIPVAIKKLDGL